MTTETLKTEPWAHSIENLGPYVLAVITCGDRKIGWHLQSNKHSQVFFVPGPDVTQLEQEIYADNLRRAEFDVVTLPLKQFRAFLVDSKENLDPMFSMIATKVGRDDNCNTN